MLGTFSTEPLQFLKRSDKGTYYVTIQQVLEKFCINKAKVAYGKVLMFQLIILKKCTDYLYANDFVNLT